jgi:Big-like domain-containing protein
MKKLLIIFGFACLAAGCSSGDGFQTIDVSSSDSGSTIGTSESTLNVQTLAIQPAYSKITGIGKTLQLSADIWLLDGSVVNDVEKSFTVPGDSGSDAHDLTWETENYGVATVDENGLVTTVSAGDTFIHAKIDGHDAVARVIVESDMNNDPNIDTDPNP